MARTLTPVDQFDGLPFRLMNIQSQPCFIKSGTVISDLEQVMVVESNSEQSLPLTQQDQIEEKVCEYDDPAEEVPQLN